LRTVPCREVLRDQLGMAEEHAAAGSAQRVVIDEAGVEEALLDAVAERGEGPCGDVEQAALQEGAAGTLPGDAVAVDEQLVAMAEQQEESPEATSRLREGAGGGLEQDDGPVLCGEGAGAAARVVEDRAGVGPEEDRQVCIGRGGVPPPRWRSRP
jgi:hypothetical protein